MRTFIFILALFFSSAAYAGGSGFENEQYSGYHKNDTCVMKSPFYKAKKPDYCSFTDKEGCCAAYSKELKTHAVYCYSYERTFGSWVDKCEWDLRRFEN